MDILRSYKMILKRRQSLESEESQPLESSHSSSTISFGTFQNHCMFHDTDTTDCELDNSAKPATTLNQIQTSRKILLRRPFSYPSSDIYIPRDNVYEKYNYLTKSSGILNDNSYIHSKFLSIYDEKLEPIKTQNSLVTIFAIWNTIMGSSLLAMAWGFEKSGLIPGIFLHAFIAGICLYTAQTILRISDSQGNCGDVPELCKILLGRWAEILAKIFSLIVLIGANIVYWILMSNFLYNSVDFIYGYIIAPDEIDNKTVLCPKEEFNRTGTTSLSAMIRPSNFYDVWNMYNTVPVFLAALMFPFLNFKSPTFFTKFNSLGAVSVCYMIAFVIVKACGWGIQEVNWLDEVHVKPTFQALSGMLALSYFIHNIIVSVMRSNRQQQHNVRDLSIAYCLVLFTYVFVGVLFYVSFPLDKSCIEDNFLNNFPKHDPLTIVARLLLLFQLFTVFPLMCFMLRMDIFTNFKILFNTKKNSEFSYVKVIILNLSVVTVCILFACFLPKIGTLIRYTGALSGMVYIFALPSLLKIAHLHSEKNLTPFICILHVIVVLLGILNFCLQFFITDS